METDQILVRGPVAERYVFSLENRIMAIAPVFPGEVVVLGLYVDGELVWMTEPVGEA